MRLCWKKASDHEICFLRSGVSLLASLQPGHPEFRGFVPTPGHPVDRTLPRWTDPRIDYVPSGQNTFDRPAVLSDRVRAVSCVENEAAGVDA